jgi:hypothetical protein
MPTREEIEEAKGKVRESLAKLREASSEQLYVALAEELIAEAKADIRPEPVKRRRWGWFLIPIVLVFLLSASAYSILRMLGFEFADTLERLITFSAKDRVYLLGFAVALASYVATVGRELVKQLPAKESREQKKLRKVFSSLFRSRLASFYWAFRPLSCCFLATS